jgi:hypothetical protein
MKTLAIKNALLILILGILFNALSAKAQGKLSNLNVLSLSFSLQTQGTFSDDGTTRIYDNPATRKLNTKDLLNQLARDKFVQGAYAANFFPSGAQLAVSSGSLVVVDKKNQFIVDVSDIIQLVYGTNVILSGRQNDTSGLASPRITTQTVVQLVFNDTGIVGGGNISFVIQGLDTIVTKDTALLTGGYKEAASEAVKSITGNGLINGLPLVITGTINGSRSQKISVP